MLTMVMESKTFSRTIQASYPFQHIAGRVAYKQGSELEAIHHFDRAYSLIQNKSYSSGYYAGVYRRIFLASDLVPQFKRADLTPEMVEDFIILVEYWAQNGNEEKAGKIFNFISH
jgi:hypothetical protein